MDFILTEEQEQYKQEFIKFANQNLNKEEYNSSFPKELWRKIANFGMLGLTVGEEYGGMGESYLTAAIAFEALGYACKNNGLIFTINNHIWVAQNLIYLYGTERLKDKYVRRMAEGELIGAFALTEAQTGSDAFHMSARAVREGDEFLLTGSKMFISNGPIADIFIVFALTNANKFTAFVVERNFPGVRTGKDIDKMGLEACPTSELILDNCRVPAENVLGHIDSGANVASAALEWERCYEFAPHVGVMQRIMEKCIEHAGTRRQFKKLLNEYQGVTHKIADMQVCIELSRIMLYKIAWLKDQGKSAYLETSIFKLYLSENYIKTCQNAMQIFGAYGYTREYELEREMRDALASTIYSGTSEIQRNTIFHIASVRSFY
jgi:alkylation response protein AidB-like acyl-CoA dehydrogenase